MTVDVEGLGYSSGTKFAGGGSRLRQRLQAGELRAAITASLDAQSKPEPLLALLARRRSAWWITFSAVQRMLQEGDLKGARILSRLLIAAESSRKGMVDSAFAAFGRQRVETDHLDRLVALLEDCDAPVGEVNEHDLTALVEVALEEAQASDAVRPSAEAVLRLARLPGLEAHAAAIGCRLLGRTAAPTEVLAALRDGSRTLEDILQVAALVTSSPDAIERFFSELSVSVWLSVADVLATSGLTTAARTILRNCVALGLLPAGDVQRLLRLEAAAADGLDSLDILNVAVLRNPAEWVLRIERAKLLVLRGELKEALSEAEAVLGAPASALTLDVAIGAYDLLHDHGRAASGLTTLVELTELHTRSTRLLGRTAVALIASGDHVAAECMLRRAIEISEPAEQTQQLLLLAKLLAESGRSQQSLTILRSAIVGAALPEVMAVFAEIAIPIVWHSVPDYVDWSLVVELQAALERSGEALHTDRYWDGIRLFLALDRPEMSQRLVEAALPRLPETGELVPGTALTQMLLEFGVSNITPAGDSQVKTEALAKTIHLQGLALLSAGRHARARICFRLAARLAPNDPAARFNAGFSAIANGQVEAALKLFDGEPRIYEQDMARVAWPVIGGLPWPFGQADFTAHFEALKPDGEDWPVITVVTPSYNQAAYIEETILSVLRQGYPKLQYIMVDGLSKDGSIEVIERYRSLIDIVIIEQDRGQTDAINKGLRLARGEIVTWINSDDMFAPGALHMLALTWMRSRADIIFGFCLPHREHGFVLANLPQVRAETFTVLHLGEIFKYWMKGHFFYQPEVIFSRRILEKVGGLLDRDLYFTMDYEFWLRCAKANAQVEAVTWPIALFRQHSEQKTANLLDCMLEQAQVRDQFVQIAPPVERQADIKARLRAALNRPRPCIGVVSSRISKIFSGDIAAHLSEQAAAELEIMLVDAAPKLPAGKFDLLVKLVHLQSDVEELQMLRASGFAGPVVGWFWDNHHHLFANFDVAEQLDIAIPGHAFARHYLANVNALAGPPLALCVTQWSAREAAAFWEHCRDVPRSDGLYGGFVRYPFARKRNLFIEKLIAEGFDDVYFLEEHALERYFGLSLEQRFHEWAEHKVSITLPLAGDLSQRCFDALLCGQVPIVPADVTDLDMVVPPELQARLPIIRFDRYDSAAVIKAHHQALAAFNAGGLDAAEARHRYALAGHSFEVRIFTLIEKLRGIAGAERLTAP